MIRETKKAGKKVPSQTQLQTILRSMTNINLSNNETINTDHIRKAL
jgi:hypothetical protein